MLKLRDIHGELLGTIELSSGALDQLIRHESLVFYATPAVRVAGWGVKPDIPDSVPSIIIGNFRELESPRAPFPLKGLRSVSWFFPLISNCLAVSRPRNFHFASRSRYRLSTLDY